MDKSASIKSITGSAPGVLDASQVSRLMKVAGSTFSFASFDHQTASTYSKEHLTKLQDLNLSNVEKLCRLVYKRVVIETSPDGISSWRFVPPAKNEDGTIDDNSWPKTVDICGESVRCSRDQWDIYCLDPQYECHIRRAPHPWKISRLTSSEEEKQFTFAVPLSPKTPHRTLKRTLASSPRLRRSNDDDITEATQKKFRSVSISEENDEYCHPQTGNVDQMVIDDELYSKRYLRSERLRKVRANIEEARRLRREWNSQWKYKSKSNPVAESVMDEDYDMVDIENEIFETTNHHGGPSTSKRKDYSSNENFSGLTSTHEFDENEGLKRPSPKRGRDLSPASIKRVMAGKRSKRNRMRQKVLNERFMRRAEDNYRTMLNNIFSDFQPYASASQHAVNSDDSDADSTANEEEEKETAETAFSDASSAEDEEDTVNQKESVPVREEGYDGKTKGSTRGPKVDKETRMGDEHDYTSETDDEAAREAAIQESIRKLRELEADRPLWEEQARRRRQREEEEKREAERRKATKMSDKQRRAEDEKIKIREDEARRAEEEAKRQRYAREQRRQAAMQQARVDRRRYAQGHWSAQSAIARYQEISEIFDKTNFHAGEIVIFESIPWPTLSRPGSYGVEDIDWKTVENFFTQAKRYLSTAEHRKLVEKSHKRFHPDRWRSRRVLQTVDDAEEKECLEAAANTVAQALTPLWAMISGR